MEMEMEMAITTMEAISRMEIRKQGFAKRSSSKRRPRSLARQSLLSRFYGGLPSSPLLHVTAPASVEEFAAAMSCADGDACAARSLLDARALVLALADPAAHGFAEHTWLALDASQALVELHADHTLAGRLQLLPEALLMLAKEAKLWGCKGVSCRGANVGWGYQQQHFENR